MSNHPRVGRVAPPDAKRDAIHVPVGPFTLGESIPRGSYVTIRSNKAYRADGPGTLSAVLDPFLLGGGLEGESCWIYFAPGTARDVRHAWSHPALDKEPV